MIFMPDNETAKSLDIGLMGKCWTSIEGLPKDIEGIAVRIAKRNYTLSVSQSYDLVFNFIRSSKEVRDLAKKEKLSGRERRNIWHYHFVGFKEYERLLANDIRESHISLDCDGAWYAAQDKLAEIILKDSYEKVENPGLLGC